MDEIIINNPEEYVKKAQEKHDKGGRPSDMTLLLQGKRRLKKQHGWYPEEKKIEVCALFSAGVTNSSELEKLTGIKAATIRTWRTEDWWPDMLEKIHVTHDQHIASKMTKIVDTALETIQDRLIEGDYGRDKETGEIYRKPVSGRDAASITNIIVDKRQLLRGKPTSRSESVSSSARLENLAKEFERFVKSKDVTKESLVPLPEAVNARQG